MITEVEGYIGCGYTYVIIGHGAAHCHESQKCVACYVEQSASSAIKTSV